MLKLKIQIPDFQRLRVDADTLNRKVANRAALHIRKRLKAGKDADGALRTVLHSDDTSGPMLNFTGELIKSIKARKSKRTERGQVVVATGTHKGGTRNGAIMAIQIAKAEGNPIDPMGESEALRQDLQATSDKEMTRQIASGKLGLVHELLRLKGKSK